MAAQPITVPFVSFRPLERDLDAAVAWYQRSAALGYAAAQCNLGVCYETGEGVEADIARALELYEKAAEQGDPAGQCNLGYLYETGRGVAQSWDQAAFWYGKAAEAGYHRAQCNLGVCYEFGYGVEKDVARAAGLYRQAAEQGDETALAVCRRYVEELALGVVDLINILQPEILALGGGVAAAPDHLLLEPLQELSARECFAHRGGRLTRGVRAELGNDAGIIGAALLGRAI